MLNTLHPFPVTPKLVISGRTGEPDPAAFSRESSLEPAIRAFFFSGESSAHSPPGYDQILGTVRIRTVELRTPSLDLAAAYFQRCAILNRLLEPVEPRILHHRLSPELVAERPIDGSIAMRPAKPSVINQINRTFECLA
jgi:hypothetical protein